ncbi:hypothetical protein FHW23_000078 [Curtobacterium pusillum]|uniref:Uncharacterized protein n=1 Tax=Curtobacterium pusillum TaxID=69373 RepID=A0AAW3T1C7_9MICO|nr:hypothetical protein [Curtobacterium pusillum]
MLRRHSADRSGDLLLPLARQGRASGVDGVPDERVSWTPYPLREPRKYLHPSAGLISAHTSPVTRALLWANEMRGDRRLLTAESPVALVAGLLCLEPTAEWTPRRIPAYAVTPAAMRAQQSAWTAWALRRGLEISGEATGALPEDVVRALRAPKDARLGVALPEPWNVQWPPLYVTRQMLGVERRLPEGTIAVVGSPTGVLRVMQHAEMIRVGILQGDGRGGALSGRAEDGAPTP